jgi:multiple sugar transport system permease protein
MSRKKLTRILMYIAAMLFVAIFLFPMIWMLLTSSKSAEEILRVPPTILPDSLSLDNYKEALKRQPIFLFLFNSLLISLTSAAFSVLITAMAGYGFSKFKFFGKELMFFIILSFLIVPFQSIVVPLFKWVTRFGLIDTYLGVILPLLVSAFGVFLMRQAMDTIPNDLIDAAMIDGCGHFMTFLKIVFPNVKTFIATQAIIKFLWSWNEFYWPLVITNKPSMKVITLGIQSFTSMYYTEHNLVMAVAVMSVLPMAIMFAIFQKGIVRAVSMSGLKG